MVEMLLNVLDDECELVSVAFDYLRFHDYQKNRQYLISGLQVGIRAKSKIVPHKSLKIS